jgi:hypothetical protein
MFWKFNSFVGSVGFALLIAAFFAGDHTVTLTLPERMSSAVWVAKEPLPIYLAYGAAFCLVWQLALTVVGFLCSCFGSSSQESTNGLLNALLAVLWTGMVLSLAGYCTTWYLHYHHMIQQNLAPWFLSSFIFIGVLLLGELAGYYMVSEDEKDDQD